MKQEDIAKNEKEAMEAKELLDLRNDLDDIETILTNCNAGLGLDRRKAEDIIYRNNADPILFVRNNNPATTVPLSRASDRAIIDNLVFLKSYLSMKLTAKLGDAAKKERR